MYKDNLILDFFSHPTARQSKVQSHCGCFISSFAKIENDLPTNNAENDLSSLTFAINILVFCEFWPPTMTHIYDHKCDKKQNNKMQ